MQWSAAVRRLLLRRVQVLRGEVLDAFNMSGAGCPMERRTSVRVDRCLYAVRVRYFEEGQVAGLRGVEHVGVVWCCLFTHHLRLHFCVFGRAVRCPKRCVRVDKLGGAVGYESNAQKIAIFSRFAAEYKLVRRKFSGQGYSGCKTLARRGTLRRN